MPGIDNMAADLALLRRAAETGRAVLRLYGWERPTLSFGRNEAARDRWDLPALASAGIDLVRRPTGGRALLHAHEVTWSVSLPLADDVPWRRVYDAVNTRLLRALRRAGVQASLVAQADAPRIAPDGPLCFDAPAVGELTFAGHKLAGSAVWRAEGGYLQHGSILLRNTQQMLTSFRRPLAAAARTLAPSESPSGFSPRSKLTGTVEAPLLHGASAGALREAIRAEWWGSPARRDVASSGGTPGGATGGTIADVDAASDSRDIPAFNPSSEDIAACDAARREISSAEWLWRR